VVGILASVFGGPGNVEEEVSRHPSDSEHDHNAPDLSQGSLAKHFVGPVRSCRRDEDFIIVAGTCVVVVLAVGDTPRVIRYQQQ
jgi:hypothetical protein